MAITASLLPRFPRIFFVYIEPILTSYGAYLSFVEAYNLHDLSRGTLPMSTLLVPTQAAGYLLLLILLGLAVLLSSPPNPRLLRIYIALLALADVPHWAGIFWTLARTQGAHAVWDVQSWDPEVRKLVFMPLVTFGVKVATLTGVFGRLG